MALINCSECGSDVSDKAAVCMRCGAPVGGRSGNAIPVAPVKPHRTFWWYWWLWGPVGAFALVMLIGVSIPTSTADANAFARVCRDMFEKGQVSSMYDCNRIEGELRTGTRQLQGADRDTAAAMEALKARQAYDPAPTRTQTSGQPETAPKKVTRKDPKAKPDETNQEVFNPYR